MPQRASAEESRRAQAFFDRGSAVAGTGNFDYAIEMYLQGLAIHPDAVEAHRALRDISLKRKASGGRDLGMFEKMKIKAGKDDRQNLLNAEKLLCYDPGNVARMLELMNSAVKGGFHDTAAWIGPICLRGMLDSGKNDLRVLLALRDNYKALKRWRSAIEALQMAVQIRPDDGDLQKELKDLSALDTMAEGKYEEGDFRQSMRNAEEQDRLLRQDKDIREGDLMDRAIADAEAQWKLDPAEPGKLMRYVEALVKSEDPDNENRAIELLEEAHVRTGQFRFRLSIGQIKVRQLHRMERSLRADAHKHPGDKQLQKDLADFVADRLKLELEEFRLASEAYPTDLKYKFEVASRLYQLQDFSAAIPLLQQARSDPKHRVEGNLLLGRAFLDAGFPDEAADTLRGLIEEYEIKGDERSIEMTYWYGRALEARRDVPAALKAYSQVAQWSFTYADVQTRIKALRQATAPSS